MTVVVRLGPLPLQRRSASRVAELERILGTIVQLVEVSTVAELILAVGAPGVVAVALDAPQPGRFSEAVVAAGALRCYGRSGDDSATREVRSTKSSTATGSSRLWTSWASLTVTCRRSENHASHSPTVEHLFFR